MSNRTKLYVCPNAQCKTRIRHNPFMTQHGLSVHLRSPFNQCQEITPVVSSTIPPNSSLNTIRMRLPGSRFYTNVCIDQQMNSLHLVNLLLVIPLSIMIRSRIPMLRFWIITNMINYLMMILMISI